MAVVEFSLRENWLIALACVYISIIHIVSSRYQDCVCSNKLKLAFITNVLLGKEGVSKGNGKT